MSNIRIPRGWEIPERLATPESTYASRRQIIKALGLGSMSALGAGVPGCGLSVDGFEEAGASQIVGSLSELLPAPPNDLYQVPERPITDETHARQYNNYYEFTTAKDVVWRLVGNFDVEPWAVEISGLCHNPGTLSLDDIINTFILEERLYRFRCVERWAMTVPWTGFPLADLIAYADPMGSAKYISMTTVDRPGQQPGLEDRPTYPWPYFEGLRLDEATNELAFMVLGLYGKPLPTQNGAPIRLITPWKYGYKSTKAVVKLEFLEERPPTFWNTLNDLEYGFFSNVNPAKAHPRWSQAEEWLLPDSTNRIATMPYNGYGEFVAGMYNGDEH